MVCTTICSILRKELILDTRSTVFTALFTALIAAGAFIIIPVGFVPITLQSLFILLAGLLGGRKIGTSSALLYIVLGAVGLPLFSGGTGGIAHLLGPTGGYIMAALPAAFLAGFFADFGRRKHPEDPPGWSWITAGAIIGTVTFYLLGVPWLKFVLGLSWTQAAAAGLTPFIIGDLLKIIAAVTAARMFSQRIEEFLYTGREG